MFISILRRDPSSLSSHTSTSQVSGVSLAAWHTGEAGFDLETYLSPERPFTQPSMLTAWSHAPRSGFGMEALFETFTGAADVSQVPPTAVAVMLTAHS